MKKEILQDIYYVGVNDRKTNLFESLWTIPMGVSYNAYIINDEKTALIDTVENEYSDLFLEKIIDVLGDKPLDYLVVNHLEPDHSGSILKIVAKYPSIKIIGNAKTIPMLQSFYGNIAETLKIDDGGELNLGKHIIKFYLIPMVHWPETMATFDTTTGAIFSGDALGCFGALNGGVTDNELVTEPYFNEMIRYYSAIVGKYGAMVQKALQKLSTLNIKAICSTHGPVWINEIPKVIKYYDKLSKYEAENGVTIVYGSMYGHTAATAEKIATAIAAKGVKNIDIYDLARVDKSFALASVFKYNTVIVGSPAYNSEVFPPVREFLAMIKERGVKNRFFASFGDYSWAKAAFKKFDDFATEMNFTNLQNAIYQKSNEQADVSDEKIEALANAVVANF